MGIEPMKRVAVLVPSEQMNAFADWLYDQSVLDIELVGDDLPPGYKPSGEPGEGVRERVAALEEVLAFCESMGAARKSFLENIFSAKTVASGEQLEKKAAAMDPESLRDEVFTLRSRRESLLERLAVARSQIERFRPFAAVDVPLGSLQELERVRVVLVKLRGRALEELERSAPDELAWERLHGDLFWVAYPKWGGEAESALTSLGVTREPVPFVEGRVREHLKLLYDEEARIVREIDRVEQEGREFAHRMAASVELALGYWQAEMHRLEDFQKTRSSGRIGLAGGYIPAHELRGFTREVRARFKGEVLAEDPTPGEAVPVKLNNRRIFEPAGLLVNMYGVPDYFSIDPTPYLSISFLVFFGICLGDAIYGVGLIAVALALMFRFRKVDYLKQFFLLFVYAGVSTFIFGVLTGTWAGDLPDYLGEGNALQRVRDFLPHFNPLQKPLVALLAVILIGVANQYYGILLLMLRDGKRGDWRGVFYDGALWLIYLTGFLLLISTAFIDAPTPYGSAGLVLFGAGAVGLVLTQGRHEDSLQARVIVGVVSLYGILGSYGAFSFLGDALSYSRLLALGLTTQIVGISFNILANIASAIPLVGLLLFGLMLIVGHTFNFTMSMISAFVHPARLILLEFFNRFYEMGGKKYRPFGFHSERVELEK